MAGEKGLDYYLNNPDEMPEDIEALAQSMSEVKEPIEPEEEVAVEEGAAADAEVKPEVVEEVEEAPLIETKSGKPAIPYAVLVSERGRRQAAEQAVESLRKEVEALSAKVEQGKAAVSEPGDTEVQEDHLANLANEFPEMGGAIKALMAKTRELETQLAVVAQQEDARKAQEQGRAANEVQEAIDASPVLRYWQAENPEMWGEAARLDDLIKANPANQSLTMSERFGKVVTAIEAIYGKAELPAAYQPAKPPDTSIEQVAAKAQAAVEKAGSFKPKTLSDMPGGATPPTSERERVETMSTAALADLMAKMDPDQLTAYLAKAA